MKCFFFFFFFLVRIGPGFGFKGWWETLKKKKKLEHREDGEE